MTVRAIRSNIQQGVEAMDTTMNPETVLSRIKEIAASGQSLSKRDVKKLNPELMKNALYFYPSWEHAVQATGLQD